MIGGLDMSKCGCEDASVLLLPLTPLLLHSLNFMHFTEAAKEKGKKVPD